MWLLGFLVVVLVVGEIVFGRWWFGFVPFFFVCVCGLGFFKEL